MMRSIVSGLSLGLAALIIGCGGSGTPDRSPDNVRQSMAQRAIEDVLAEHTPEWMALDGVIGTGVGECDGKPCIKILIVQKSDSLFKRIPKEIEGYPVRLEVTGEIQAN